MYYIANLRGGPKLMAVWKTGVTNVIILRTLLKQSVIRNFFNFCSVCHFGDWLFQSQINLSRPLKYSPRMRLCYLNITYLRCYFQVIHILRTKGNVFPYQLVTLFQVSKYRLYIFLDRNKILANFMFVINYMHKYV